MWWQVLILIFVIWIIIFQWKKRKYMKLNMEFKNSIKELPLLGHAYLFIGNGEDRMNAIETLGREALKQGGVTSLWMAHQFYLMVADPEFADVILKTCLEKNDLKEIMRPLTGNGNLFAPVSIWRPRRKILSSAFSSKYLNQFVNVMSKQSCVMRENLQSKVGNGPFSLWKYITTYTMDSIFESTMGVNINSQNNHDHPFLKAFEIVVNLTADRLVQPWLHNDIMYKMLPQYKRMMESKDFGWDFINQIIQAKREAMKDELQEKVDSEDGQIVRQESLRTLMEIMLESSGGDHGYTDLELLEENLIILLAGTDTTAVGISFTALMLARHPDVQDKVYKELKEVFGDSSRPVMAADLSQLKYLEVVIKETLRLYPPVPLPGPRIADRNITLSSGTILVAGTNIAINIPALHRNPRYWGPDAEEFRPERFINITLKHPAQYMPFSFGARNCIGYRYGMMSMKTVLATLLRQYRLLPATLRDTACNSGSHTSTAEQHPPLRLRFNLMIKDVDDFQIKLESRN